MASSFFINALERGQMFQFINGQYGYVVELGEKFPPLPVTGVGDEIPFAAALTNSIQNGTIKEPGKYFIHFTNDDLTSLNYEVSRVYERDQ